MLDFEGEAFMGGGKVQGVSMKIGIWSGGVGLKN